jgi:Na+-transporting methylmalonyl-CoA/oxaloacetate decarboxylase gamma subunit
MVETKKVSRIIIGITLAFVILLGILFTFIGMPFFAIIISIPILIFAILGILIIKYKPQESSQSHSTKTADPVSYEEVEGLPSETIKCPNCNEKIPKGLKFCPECGERIPPEGLFQ